MPPPESVQMVYLKNVLLQFIELKDKNRQVDLVSTLQRLLYLNDDEKKKWLQVIQSK